MAGCVLLHCKLLALPARHVFVAIPFIRRALQEQCGERLTVIDPTFAQTREQGGYRQFYQMTQGLVTGDPYLGSVPLVSFTDEFVIAARGSSTIYFSLRYCYSLGIPVPMRVDVSIKSNEARTSNGEPSFSAVCLSSSLKPHNPVNSTIKSVVCESDVGERSFKVFCFACARDAWCCASGQSCLLKGYRDLRAIEDDGSFKGNKVFNSCCSPRCSCQFPCS